MWQPVTTGSGAIADVLHAIVDDQLAHPFAEGATCCDLMRGDPGRAVMLAYAGRALGDARATQHAALLLERAVEHFADASDVATFFAGFPGCAWALEHLRELIDLPADANDVTDEALVEIVVARPGWLAFEWLIGASGLAIYALERRRAPLLHAVLDYLDDAVWETPAGMLVAKVTGLAGPVRLTGAAHGVVGGLAAVAGLAAAGIDEPRARALCGRVADWLRAQRSAGPLTFSSVATLPESELGWCRGDAGIAGCLAAAGRALRQPELAELALETAVRLAGTLADTQALVGRSLCHGWAGIAHVMTRLYNATRDERLAAAARVAIDRLLAIPGDGDASLLTGSAGVALSLLAATTEIEPAWDRALLLSYA